MSYVLTEKKDNVCTLTINRPESLNALNADVLRDLDKAVDAAAADGGVRVIVITGAGRAFVAGADIQAMADLDMQEGRAFGQIGQVLFRKIEKMEKPTIAAVNGFALGGGCELALCCDMRIASEQAVFGQPEVGLGITPGFSGDSASHRSCRKGEGGGADSHSAEYRCGDGSCDGIGEPRRTCGQADGRDIGAGFKDCGKCSAGSQMGKFSHQKRNENGSGYGDCHRV